MTAVQGHFGLVEDFPSMTVEEKSRYSHQMLDDVLDDLDFSGKKVVAIVGLFSGGNDSVA